MHGMKQIEEILITFYRTASVFKTFKIYSCPPPHPLLVVLPIEIGDRAVIMMLPLFQSLSFSLCLSRSLSFSLSKTVTCSIFHIQ